MSYDLERRYIEEFYIANVTLPGGMPTYFENTPDPRNNTQPHAKIIVRDGIENQVSMGASTNIYRNNGFIVCEIRHTEKEGTGAVLSAVDVVVNAFRKQQFNGISIISSRVDRIGLRDGWYQVNVLIEFRRDAIF